MTRYSNNIGMKKLFIVLSLLFFTLPFFADAKNIVYNNSFDYKNINTLSISLTCENLKISRIYGDEIVVEIGSNNIKKIPEVVIEQPEQEEDFSTLKITSVNKRSPLGFNCTVYVYLPQDFYAQQISISNMSGNIQADILNTQDAIYISNMSGRTDIAASSCDYLSASSVSGNLTLQKISTGYFDIKNVSGNTFLELENTIEAKSRVTSVSGKIQVYYKKNESPFLDDSPELFISTVSGKVETVPFD